MLTPFWGAGESAPWYGPDALTKYRANGERYFELVDRIEDADLAVLPSTWHRYLSDGTEGLALEFAAKTVQAGKAMAVFHERDHDFRFPHRNTILFSPTIEERRGPREFGLPAWVCDHLDGPAPPRSKSKRPLVGFCGWVRQKTAASKLKQLLLTSVPPLARKRIRSYSASVRNVYRHRHLRAEIIELLERAPEIRTNFILRDTYFARALKRQPGNQTEEARNTALNDFLTNLTGSDYNLCVRGVGNYSARFYESLAAGRIPLFVNTDCVLPYDFLVDWSNEFVWIDWSVRGKIASLLDNFHRRQSESDFLERQARLRSLWDEYLSPDGFFRNFYRHFRSDSSILSQVA